ncbi:MAG: serine dehydratase subunit alpha family protein [Planctomycetes bacterium]|nr:serine dehydratase subunit alpha family protein [Planctomycetota bacterium]
MYTIKDILQTEVTPALGCTEPVAVALCTAAAGSLLPNKHLKSIELWLSSNIFKNAYAVAIPGAHGAVGIDLAATLGFFCGDPKLELQVLAPMNNDAIQTANSFLKEHPVKIHLSKDKPGIYIKCRLCSNGDTAEAVIEKTHNNLVSLNFNGENITSNPLLTEINKLRHSIENLEEFLKKQSLEEMLMLINQMDDEDYDFIRQGVEYNLKLADHGLTFGDGLGVGKTLDRLTREGLLQRDMMLSAKILTSSACDARMYGVKLPAMSSAGSGNLGLTAILPVWAVNKSITITDQNEVLKAIALSHIVTVYIKSHTGRLSAVCGCSVAAGSGAAAAITYLMGGNLNQIAGAIKNLIGDITGVICDGAKASCAFKLATAAGTAVQAALFALHGLYVKDTDGIIAFSPEQTMKNIGEISTEGMGQTDNTIIKIMINK